MSQLSFVVGAITSDHVILEIFGHVHPGSKDPVKSNWLKASLSVSAGAWRGRLENVDLNTQEVAQFRAQVEALASQGKGLAALEPLESFLVLKLTGGPDFIDVSGVAFDQPDGHNALAFNWPMDPAQLKPLLKQLQELESAYPVSK